MGECTHQIETYCAGDGYRCHYRHYTPATAPRACVVGIHGIQSHGGWYIHSCDQLREAGFEVFFLDRRGSGLNAEARGDAPGFRQLLDDIAEFLNRFRDGEIAPPPHPYPSPPGGEGRREALAPRGRGVGVRGRPLKVFLMAISWGGKLATALMRRHPGLVDGLALLCPGFRPKIGPSFRERLAILWARLVDHQRLFPIPLNDPELFTATPRWQQFIRDDPLGLREATARFLVESVRLDGYLRFARSHVSVPVLLMLAGHDRIINNDQTRRFVACFASADQQTVEYPQAHHTLEFEPEPERHIRDLISWLERHFV